VGQVDSCLALSGLSAQIVLMTRFGGIIFIAAVMMFKPL